MINICTTSDINYLIKGLTLYESLLKHDEDILLHYLCFDDESYNKLKEYTSISLKPYHINELLIEDDKLKELKRTDYKYFCYCTASYFCKWLLNKSEYESITYIDSDIYFHHSIKIILDAIWDKEVAIFRHRQFKKEDNRPEGMFNVGIVHFKDRIFGNRVLDWWYYAVLKRLYPELATCGDQRYLDNFPNLCPEDKIFIDGDIGHGAPWLWQLYDLSKYESEGKIIWEGKEQLLIFTHFSQFVYDLKNNSYDPSTMHRNYTQLEDYRMRKELKLIYDNYYKEIVKTNKKYNG